MKHFFIFLIFGISLLISGCKKAKVEPPLTAFEVTGTKRIYDTLTFVNKSLEGSQYFWEFGDSKMSVEMSPQHMYDRTGIYKVKLYVIRPDLVTVDSQLVKVTAGIDSLVGGYLCNSH